MLPRSLGRYELLRVLGTGGMATVYLGRVVGPGGFERLVAIKMIHEQWAQDPSSVAMFLDEARLAASVRHPNVVQVHEVGLEEGRYFIAMDYVAGAGLARVLQTAARLGEPIPLGFSIHCLAQVAHGLHAAHETKDTSGRLLGMIHRDVAPKNILVGFDGVSRILDFGVAKARDRLNVTAVKMPKGTLAYMAPEQLDGAKLDRRVDVFALGIVLWEMLTRKRLFPADVWTDRGKVVPPSSIADVPEQLDEIALRALAADPARRYATARELAVTLLDAERSLGIRWSTVESEELLRTLAEAPEQDGPIPEGPIPQGEEGSTDSGNVPSVVVSSVPLYHNDEVTEVRADTESVELPVRVPELLAAVPPQAPLGETPSDPDPPTTEVGPPADCAVTHVGPTPSEPALTPVHDVQDAALTVPLQRRPSSSAPARDPANRRPPPPVTDQSLLDKPSTVLLLLAGIAALAFLSGLAIFSGESPAPSNPPAAVRTSTSGPRALSVPSR
jgi:serine/threonine-protein kinase